MDELAFAIVSEHVDPLQSKVIAFLFNLCK